MFAALRFQICLSSALLGICCITPLSTLAAPKVSSNIAAPDGAEPVVSVAELAQNWKGGQQIQCTQTYNDEPGRSISRHDFATGMSSCLNELTERFNSGAAKLSSKPDLANTQQHQDQLNRDRSNMQNRLEQLEQESEQQAAKQFSPTTKLNAQAVFGLTTTW